MGLDAEEEPVVEAADAVAVDVVEDAADADQNTKTINCNIYFRIILLTKPRYYLNQIYLFNLNL